MQKWLTEIGTLAMSFLTAMITGFLKKAIISQGNTQQILITQIFTVNRHISTTNRSLSAIFQCLLGL